jgi:hypothetical protein
LSTPLTLRKGYGRAARIAASISTTFITRFKPCARSGLFAAAVAPSLSPPPTTR